MFPFVMNENKNNKIVKSSHQITAEILLELLKYKISYFPVRSCFAKYLTGK